MMSCGQVVRVARLAVKSRILFVRSQQSLPKPLTCHRSVRAASTLVRSSSGLGSADKMVSPANVSAAEHWPVPWHKVINVSDAVAEKDVSENMFLYEDFISEDEEQSLFNEVEPYLKRLKYEHDHWDDVSGFSLIYL